MKKSELKKLVSEYKSLQLKLTKSGHAKIRTLEKLAELKHRYFHETGNDLESDLGLDSERT